MAKSGKTVAALFAGAAIGVAIGYLLATDKETREEDLKKVKKGLNDLKDKFAKKSADVEEEIYHT